MRAEQLNLQQMIRFMPERGMITVGDQRSFVFNQTALAKLRRLLHDQLGNQLSRSILARFGFESGSSDFANLQSNFNWQNEDELLKAGPMMHAWSGIVRVLPKVMEYNRESGHFLFKGEWHNSYEASCHLEEFGQSKAPVCHSLTGYGSGWCSAFMGQPMIEIETSCRAMGAPHCQWEIRPASAWDKSADPWKESLKSDQFSLIRELELKNLRIQAFNTELKQEVARQTASKEFLLKVLYHDLKTPLEIMRQSIESALENPYSSNELQTAQRALNAAMETIGSSFEQNEHPDGLTTPLRHESPQRVEDILHNACDSVASLALQKDIRLKIKTKPSTKELYSADPKVLKNQILVNIITNAIKFSPRHSDVTLSLDSLSEKRFLITVRDRGIGMPDTVIKSLCTSPRLPSEIGTAGEIGQGHGLQIALGYTKMLAGKLHLTSRNAHDFPRESGTEVSIELPSIAPYDERLSR